MVFAFVLPEYNLFFYRSTKKVNWNTLKKYSFCLFYGSEFFSCYVNMVIKLFCYKNVINSFFVITLSKHLHFHQWTLLGFLNQFFTTNNRVIINLASNSCCTFLFTYKSTKFDHSMVQKFMLSNKNTKENMKMCLNLHFIPNPKHNATKQIRKILMVVDNVLEISYEI